MTGRERMLAAFRREPTDRVPTDIWATPEVWRKLEDQFGDREQIRAALHIDGMASVGATYIGPPAEAPPGESADFWGIRRKPVVYEGGDVRVPGPLLLPQPAAGPGGFAHGPAG
ncbi:MAG: hypothetical protein HYW07_00955 [Candidatus Latescibacteria bacterium]|nr:hypothetical protein [Candidatus Latescibacterota bacterium]